MKNFFIEIFFLLICIRVFIGCNKEELQQEEQDLYDPDFIEFTLDGTQVRIEDDIYSLNAIGTGIFLEYPATSVFTGAACFLITAASNPYNSISLYLNDSVPLNPQSYADGVVDNILMFFVSMKDGSGYYAEEGSACSINILQADTLDGGIFEAEFSFENINYMNTDGTIASSNHIITNGKFKVTVSN